MKHFSGLLAGLLFGAGLAASGMTNTSKVIGFLDIFGAWDADLLMVMASAVITTFIGFAIILKRKKPLFDSQFFLPTAQHIDRNLIVGAILFGVGWGLYGYCPGPAIASLVYLSPVTFIFVFCMLIGMGVGNFMPKLLKNNFLKT
jgi:uncharacterized membrane protein YedE/YeeE